MSVFNDISYALENHLNTMTGLPPVAWENRVYRPVKGTLYLRATLLPADTVIATIGDASATDENLGIYQVDVFAPSGKGKGEAIQMADTIANRFKRDTELTYNSRLIRIVEASYGAAIAEGDWYHLPVNIRYQSFTLRR